MSTVCLLDQQSQLWLASICLSAAFSVTLIRTLHQLIFIQLLEKHIFLVKLFQEWNQALSRAIEDLKSRNKRKEGLDNNWVSIQVFSTTGLVFSFVWWSLRVTVQSRLPFQFLYSQILQPSEQNSMAWDEIKFVWNWSHSPSFPTSSRICVYSTEGEF